MYEELVKRLRKRAVNLKEKFSRNAELLSELMEAADAIEELSRAQEQWIEQERKALLKSIPRWIPVTERLPEPYVPVIVAIPDKGRTYEAFRVYSDREDGEWTFYVGALHDHRRAVAWMPLPEPPKEEA